MFNGGMGDIMKQAQQMQERMKEAQEAVQQLEVQGESGAGLVSVTMSGRHDVTRVNLDHSLMHEDKAMVEDLLAAAVNDAVRKVEKESRDKMSELTGGLDLPPGFKMPF